MAISKGARFTPWLRFVERDRALRKVFVILSSLLILWTVALPVPAYGVDVTILGADWDWLLQASARDWLKMCLGGVGAALVHELGHVAYAEIKGMDIDYGWSGGFRTVVRNPREFSSGEMRMFARSGFLLQHLVGSGLSLFKRTSNSYFSRGYMVVGAIGTLTYPLRHGNDGDFDMIDRYGGNPGFEYALYSGWSLVNLVRIEW